MKVLALVVLCALAPAVAFGCETRTEPEWKELCGVLHYQTMPMTPSEVSNKLEKIKALIPVHEKETEWSLEVDQKVGIYGCTKEFPKCEPDTETGADRELPMCYDVCSEAQSAYQDLPECSTDLPYDHEDCSWPMGCIVPRDMRFSQTCHGYNDIPIQYRSSGKLRELSEYFQGQYTTMSYQEKDLPNCGTRVAAFGCATVFPQCRNAEEPGKIIELKPCKKVCLDAACSPIIPSKSCIEYPTEDCTTPPGWKCGNSVIDEYEECDLGVANSNWGECNDFCKYVEKDRQPGAYMVWLCCAVGVAVFFAYALDRWYMNPDIDDDGKLISKKS